MKKCLEKILNEYLSEKNKPFRENEFNKYVINDIPEILYTKLKIDRNKYLITASTGKGNWATIPWIAIFDKDITITAKRGYYIVILFNSDMTGFYLSLNQGYTWYEENFKTREAKKKIKFMAEKIRKELRLEESNIDLHTNISNAKGYEAGNIYSFYYEKNSNYEEYIKEDINELIIKLDKIKKIIGQNWEAYNKEILDIRNESTLEDFKEYYIKNKTRLENTEEIISQRNNIETFRKEYNIEKLKEMNLNDYVVGKEQSLCYKMEFGIYKECGPSIGGAPAYKYGIYYSKEKEQYLSANGVVTNPEEKWKQIRAELIKTIESVKNAKNVEEIEYNNEILKNMSAFAIKLVYFYFPQKLICICGRKNLIAILEIFKYGYDKNLSTLQLAFLINEKIRKDIPELKDEDPELFGIQLWNYLNLYTANDKEDTKNTYTKYDFLDDVFIKEEQYDTIIDTLKRKKNIIFQGPPGVGKTYCAKKIIHSLINQIDDSRIELVQFHQSYSYEDFVQGYRPNKEGKFELKDGVFYKIVEKACKELEDARDNNREPKEYYIIIDEINRGNLSKIFGELMMLIESDKRDKKWKIKLTYSDTDDSEGFYVPENLYIIGTMNTADRSLTMIDYALRRRFAFIELQPAFNDEKNRNKLKKYLIDKEHLNSKISDEIINSFSLLNSYIEENLGKEFMIGHSYFVNQQIDLENFSIVYNDIIEYEIKPLIEEYFYDDKSKIEEALKYITIKR